MLRICTRALSCAPSHPSLSSSRRWGTGRNLAVRRNAAKRSGGKNRLLIYDSLLSHTHIVRKLTFLGVQKCGCVTIGYPRKKVIRSQSAKNGLILYEDFELRNEVTVTFPIEGIFQDTFGFKLPHTHGTLS